MGTRLSCDAPCSFPPARGKVGMEGQAQVAGCQTHHPRPGPPPSQGEGSRCAHLTWFELVHVQETSLVMQCLPCKSPLTSLYQREEWRETMANKVR